MFSKSLHRPALVIGSLLLFALSLSGCGSHGESGQHEYRIVVTSPARKAVISTQQYVGQIRSCQHIMGDADKTLMWVYFNVPEARYFEYQAELDKKKDAHSDWQIELKLANGKIFPQPGKFGAIEGDFNNTTGTIAFRADFPNPDGLLRNGQTGTVLIHRSLQDVIVIPQRATYEILDRRYVYVIDNDNVIHQRAIAIQSEQDDIFVIQEGLEEGDKIVLEGIRQVRDGDKVEYTFQAPDKVLGHLK